MPSTNSTNSTIAMMMPAQNRNLAIPIAAPAMRAKPAAALADAEADSVPDQDSIRPNMHTAASFAAALNDARSPL